MPSTGSLNINEDIAKERRSATFNTDDITRQLYTDVNARRLACKYLVLCCSGWYWSGADDNSRL